MSQDLQSMAGIARHLGITPVSVSLALRNSPAVSRELCEKVQELAQKSGFKPRAYRRRSTESRPATGRSGKIGALMPRHDNDPVAQIITNHVTHRLLELNIPFEIVAIEDFHRNPALAESFSGVIFYYKLEREDIALFSKIPHVAVMYEWLDSGPDVYKPNEWMAGKLAADYLLKQKFKNMLLVWEKKMTYQPAFNPRLESFRRQIQVAGSEFFEIGYTRENTQALYAEMLRILEHSDNRLGIFAYNDQIAYQLCTAIDAFGLRREPEKLEVVSCDNTYLIETLHPSLPVVDSHIGEISERAVDGLLWRIEHPDAKRTEVLIDPELIVP